MIQVRVDDFPHTKDAERDHHSIGAFREFHRELSACLGGRRYLLGVIPKRCTVDDVIFLRNETDCVIGMHGIFHDESKLDIWKNEFPPYLSKNEVGRHLVDVAHGMEEAIGRRVEVYMPPRNYMDERTASVLLDSGFIAFTTGPETDQAIRGKYSDMVIHSQVPWEYGRCDELLQRNAHRHLIDESDAGRDVTLTLHWTWETNIGLHHMRDFFVQIPTRYFKDFGS